VQRRADPLRQPHQRLQLVAVVDTNVFPHRRWIRPLLLGAQAGYVLLVWSPLIIAEVSRLLTWHWIRTKSQGSLDRRSWDRCSADFKTWFDFMTHAFRVVDDRPPPAPMWTESPRDPWDRPVWTTAVRAKERFSVGGIIVITENLSDGPPPNVSGIREHDGVLYLHPERFLAALDEFADYAEAGQAMAERTSELSLELREYLRLVSVEGEPTSTDSEAEPR
jgi:hypothetical protein